MRQQAAGEKVRSGVRAGLLCVLCQGQCRKKEQWREGQHSVNLSLRCIKHEGFLCSLEMSSLQLAVDSKESQLNWPIAEVGAALGRAPADLSVGQNVQVP